ncbi:MAG: acyl carrier protein [Myxococcota bacterium]
MEYNDLLSLFRERASEIAEEDLSCVAADASIAELGLDSLSTLELVGEFERELAIRIEMESLSGVDSVGQFIHLVQTCIGHHVGGVTAA